MRTINQIHRDSHHSDYTYHPNVARHWRAATTHGKTASNMAFVQVAVIMYLTH